MANNSPRKFASAMVLGVALVLAILLLAVFQLNNNSEAPQTSADASCWGCVPIERLRDALPQSDTVARDVLSGEIHACASDPSCRVAPQQFFTATCAGAWPNEPTFARLSVALDDLISIGGQCRDMVCPDVDCATRARTVSVLGELRNAISQTIDAQTLSDGVGEHVAEANALALRIVALRGDNMAAQDWIAEAEAWTLAANAYEGDLAIGWRLRRVADSLGEISRILDMDDAAPHWPSIFALAAEIVIELERAQASTNALNGAACGGLETPRAQAIAERARDAEALLAVCAARAACAGRDVASGLAPFDARAISGVDALRAFADQAAEVLEQNAPIGLVAQGAPDMSLERDAFAALEAIRVELDLSTSACMTEPGALLAIRGIGSPEANLFEAQLSSSRQQEILLEAPQAVGSYEVVAVAPLARGSAVLPLATIEVTTPRPETCDGFTGVWETEFGELVLYQQGGAARGTYRRFEDVRPGFLFGDVREGVLRGNWQSELGSGSVRLRLAGDGRSFSGSWQHVRGIMAGSGRWSGSCAIAE